MVVNSRKETHLPPWPPKERQLGAPSKLNYMLPTFTTIKECLLEIMYLSVFKTIIGYVENIIWNLFKYQYSV